MNLWNRVNSVAPQWMKRAALQVGAGMSISDLDRVMDMVYGGSPSYTGKLVSETTALQVGAVWASVGVISDDIATAPFYTYYQQDPGQGKILAKDHYLWSLLTEEANPELTSFRFKQLMQLWVLLWGNAFAELELNGRGQIAAIWPWRPDRVKISRGPDGSLWYTYRDSKGNPYTVPHDRMFHLRGMSLDGILGLSPIEYHKQTVGLNMAMVEHGARLFSNGARPLGLLKVPEKLSETAYERLKKEWASEHQGLENAHRVAILEEGLDWKEAGFNMVDAQYLDVMKFTVRDIARIYKVPPHRIGDLEQSTNNNIEHQGLEYIQTCLGPWAENWVAEISFAMLSLRERPSILIRPNFRHLLIGDHATMGTFISQMTSAGVMNADEARDLYLDLNPQADGLGKTYWKAVNTMPVTKALLDPKNHPLAGKNSNPSVGNVEEQDQAPPPPTKSKPNGALHRA